MLPSCPELREVEICPGWWLSAERSLYLSTERTLVVADLHWGYAQSHRLVGNLLPLWGNEALAVRLRRLIAHYQPKRMIWLGDSLHTAAAAEAAEIFLEGLDSLETIVIAGNHDRRWPRADREEFRLGSLVFHHGDKNRSLTQGETEIIGHLHPAFSFRDGAGLRLKIPILVQSPLRVILPSFSDWSSGATWNNQGQAEETLWLISSRKVWPLRRETNPLAPPSCLPPNFE